MCLPIAREVGAQLITYTNTLAQLVRKVEGVVIGLNGRSIGVAEEAAIAQLACDGRD
jgi:hypothetical protein